MAKPRKTYILEEGSLHEAFLQSRNKVRIFGGGFANGKTTALVILTLQIAEMYPGANMLLARSTYPKLNDTLRKAFLEWCPKHWIKSFPKTENVCELVNGTTINFRYLAQKSQTDGNESSSNLLSATYDFIGIDQVEDPEIEEKDFDDMLGRLRGDTPYMGVDVTMPRNGPRWIALTCNPTRNWVFRSLVEPLHYYAQGKRHPKLMCDTEGVPLIDLVEGSTYTNARNLPADFITTLEAKYTGQMRDRYLQGKWAAYEGLVYPQFSTETHVLTNREIEDYMSKLRGDGYELNFIEGYDYGMAAPACYLAGFVDNRGNVIIVDGFYEKEKTPDWQASQIARIRGRLGIPRDHIVYADPDIFRRKSAGAKLVGASLSALLEDEYGIRTTRGNNDITSGITKVSMYLNTVQFHRHPISGNWMSPRLYFNETLSFIPDEFGDYYWKRLNNNDNTDKPIDRNDHAMDTLKYMLTDRPEISMIVIRTPAVTRLLAGWTERETQQVKDPRAHRHG